MKQAKHTPYTAAATLPLIPELEPSYDRTVPQNYLESVAKFGQDTFLGYRAGLSTHVSEMSETYTHMTYYDSMKYVENIVNELQSLGIVPGDRVCIYGKNSPLWLLADIAIAFCEAIVVPIYDTLGVENIQYCIDYVGARAIFVGTPYLGNILGMLHLLPSVQHVIQFDTFADTAEVSIAAQKVYLKLNGKGGNINEETPSLLQSSVVEKTCAEGSSDHLEVPEIAQFVAAMMKEGASGATHLHVINTNIEKTTISLKPIAEQKSTDPGAIIFTSGTSGLPKAVVASSRNLYAGGICMGRRLQPYNKADSGIQSSTISYLPLAHVFERGFEHYCYCRGYCIKYYSGSVKNLTEDIALAKPTIMIGVPRVYTKIYQGVMSQIKSSGFMVRTLFNVFYNAKKNYMAKHPETFRTGRVAFYDKIFGKIEEKLGGNLEVMVTASSALLPEVLDFLRTCTGARLMHGYGSTETSATGLVICSGDPLPSASALGYACEDTEVVLIDSSDVCEFSLEKDGVGEILIKGPGVCLGYMRSSVSDLTPIADKDGYYHTGDLGRLHPDGSVSFLRRISLVQKLQHGEFVDLDRLESCIEASPLVLQCFAYADPAKSAPVCICSVDSNALRQRMATQRPAGRSAEQVVLTEVDEFVKKTMLSYCVPKAVHIVYDEDWSADPQLYTPSQKKQHRNFRTHFAKEIQELLRSIE